MIRILGSSQIGFSRSAEGTITFKSLDPRNNAVFDTAFFQATTEETEKALELAAKAAPLFSQMPVSRRAGFMKEIASEMDANRAQLTEHFCRESGLAEDRANSELTRTCFQLVSYADALLEGKVLNAVITSGDPDRKPSPRPELRKVGQALGPVAIFGASNFPFAYSTAGGDTASAFAAGCPVIVKAHAMHPATSELVATVISTVAQRMNLPEGVFSHLFAKDYKVGEQLVTDSRLKAVGFTGSIQGGMALHKAAGSRPDPIPVFAEMGSVNPIVVMPAALDQRSDKIMRTIAGSISLNAGQFCTSPGLLFVVRSAASEKFVADLVSELKSGGEQVMLNPGIKEHYEMQKHIQRLESEHLLDPSNGGLNRIQPAVFAIDQQEFIRNIHRQDEVFGSFILFVYCDSTEGVKKCLSKLRGQLTGSIFCEKTETAEAEEMRALLAAKVGRVIFNGVPTGVEVVFAQHHGGTFPASTDSRFTAVGGDAILRWLRPVTYQNCPDELLPALLQNGNPEGILRFVNEKWTSEPC